MAKLLKLRGGTTSQHGSFTGSDREVTVDTDKETLVVHNGSQAGGFPLARADGSGSTNFTITGELDCATLDVSGDADIDGTLEADAITINGVTLAETISDTVGAMVSSNTESNITVTYQDSDNTLDFAVASGISNGNLLAANANVADNDFLRIDGTSVEGRTAAETLSDIGASPVAGSSSIVTTGALNSGSITSGFGSIDVGSSTITTTGAIAGTLSTAAQGNVTSLGTLTALQVDNMNLNGNTYSASGDLTFDCSQNIILDADGGNIRFKDGGTEYGTINKNSTANLSIFSSVSDADILLQGNDGGSVITALTLDMSSAGAATFNNNVTAFSDERLKSNIETIDGGLEKVLSMRGVTYTRDDMDNVGVIAQEVEKVIPQIVLTADDEMGTKSVDYSRITAVLIEAVKELKTQLDAKCDCECKGE